MLPEKQVVMVGHNWEGNTVIVSDADAGTREVPAVVSASDCRPDGGYYAVMENAAESLGYGEYMTDSVTFTLCPVSCAEHLQFPQEIFTLERGPCGFTIE
jgi:hypothetical protein